MEAAFWSATPVYCELVFLNLYRVTNEKSRNGRKPRKYDARGKRVDRNGRLGGNVVRGKTCADASVTFHGGIDIDRAHGLQWFGSTVGIDERYFSMR